MQLYKLDFPSKKSYIGITSKTAKERFEDHFQKRIKSRSACQKAIHKYGKENVVLTVLATVDNWELLCLSEIEAIEKFNTFSPNGYNLTRGGDGSLGVIVSNETKLKLSKAGKYRVLSEESKRKISIGNTGKKATDSTKKKLSIARKKRPPNTEEYKLKMSIATSGRKKTDAEIEKQKATKIKNKHEFFNAKNVSIFDIL